MRALAVEKREKKDGANNYQIVVRDTRNLNEKPEKIKMKRSCLCFERVVAMCFLGRSWQSENWQMKQRGLWKRAEMILKRRQIGWICGQN